MSICAQDAWATAGPGPTQSGVDQRLSRRFCSGGQYDKPGLQLNLQQQCSSSSTGLERSNSQSDVHNNLSGSPLSDASRLGAIDKPQARLWYSQDANAANSDEDEPSCVALESVAAACLDGSQVTDASCAPFTAAADFFTSYSNAQPLSPKELSQLLAKTRWNRSPHPTLAHFYHYRPARQHSAPQATDSDPALQVAAPVIPKKWTSGKMDFTPEQIAACLPDRLGFEKFTNPQQPRRRSSMGFLHSFLTPSTQASQASPSPAQKPARTSDPARAPPPKRHSSAGSQQEFVAQYITRKASPQQPPSVRMVQCTNEGEVAALKQEARLLDKLRDNKRVVALHCLFLDQDARTAYLSTEMIPGRTLAQLMESAHQGHNQRPLMARTREQVALQEALVQQIAVELLQAIGDMHLAGVAHMDITPANILVSIPVDENALRVVLANLGAAIDEETRDASLRRRRASGYEAPEVAAAWSHHMDPHRPPCLSGNVAAADCWSAGVVLYEALFQEKPFPVNTVCDRDDERWREIEGAHDAWAHGLADEARKRRMLRNLYQLGPAALDFFCGLLQPDMDQRLTAAEALAHPYLAVALP